MTDLLTVYDDDEESNTFIDCLVCNRKIRGDTQYKVHLTTPQHLKKEEVLAANGVIPKPQPLPKWTDFKQYLEYLQLDEPIIGLDSLVQEEDFISDGKAYLKYRCTMCSVGMVMSTMVSHIVSRKHRQKYLQLKRPDLLNQNNGMAQKQPGLVARAKAAIVEKQDGWGTPVPLNRSDGGQSYQGKKVKKGKQGHRKPEGSNSYTHEMSHEKDKRGQLSLAEDAYRRSSDFWDDLFGRPSHYYGDDRNDGSRGDTANWRSYPKNDQSENVYSHDGRQRTCENESQNEQPYLKGDGSVRSFVQDDDGARQHADRVIPGRSYHDEHRDDFYPAMNPRREWDSGADLYHVSVPRSRFADPERSGSAQLPEMDYRVDRQIQGQVYASHSGRGHGLDEMQRVGRSLQYEEGREARAGSFEMQGYGKRGGSGDYAQEHAPAKRKRKSRFSDATPLEIALTQNRVMDVMVPTKNQNRGPVQALEERLDSGVRHPAVNTENVLDVLNEVKIDTAEEATFLKEKLCAVLKEFHANKSQRVEVSPMVRDYSTRSDTWMDQRRNMHETRNLDEHGFQETTRYVRDHRDFQERKTFTNDSTGLQDTWRPEENSGDFQNTRYVKDHRHVQDMRGYEKDSYQESARYEKRSTDFQELRHFENTPADFQQSRGFGDNPRDFHRSGHFEAEHKSFQQERGFQENSRDFQRAGNFEGNTSTYQQASGFEESSRAGRVEDNPRSFQNIQHTRGAEEKRGYEEYSGRAAEGRYGEGDYRRFHSNFDSRREFEYDVKRELSAEPSDDFKDYHPDGDRRAYQESCWKTRSLTEEDKGYGESRAHRPQYQRDRDPDVELYDPFHPSSSPPPPQGAAPPSSLEKLASTLLELVARTSN
ncbi:uncharacterized protein [Salminus brasiliensis]|uniref:uncharacterized protein isoform X2 n=1 Tax=Salminus brasiliensis TaxID=930266 RepID=UPI003B83354B